MTRRVTLREGERLFCLLVECVRRTARRSASLGDQHDPYSFQPVGIAGGTAFGPVLCPSGPSETLHMCLIIDVVVLSHFPGQTDPDAFQTFGLPARPGHGSVLTPFRLPSVSLHMRLIFNIAAVWLRVQPDVDSLQPLGLPCRSGHIAIRHPALIII